MRPQPTIIGSALISMTFRLPILSTKYILDGVATIKPAEVKATKVEASEAEIEIGESGAMNATMPGELHP